MTARTGTFDEELRVASRGRWWQLLVGVLCMSMIANLQYGWTLFVNPIADKYGWSRAAIQIAFTLIVHRCAAGPPACPTPGHPAPW